MATEYIDTSINPADYIEVWEVEDAEHGKQLVMAVDDLKFLPPSDVRPVDVGLWLRIGNTGLASCKCGFITDRYSTYRYYPSCGRKNGGVEYGG